MRCLALVFCLCLAPITVAEEPRSRVLIEGVWSGTADDGTEVTYTFTRQGEVNWSVSADGFQEQFPQGLNGQYEILQGEPFWTIDIKDFDHPMFAGSTFVGILEKIDNKSLRMEGAPSRAEQPAERLSDFTEKAIVFYRKE